MLSGRSCRCERAAVAQKLPTLPPNGPAKREMSLISLVSSETEVTAVLRAMRPIIPGTSSLVGISISLMFIALCLLCDNILDLHAVVTVEKHELHEFHAIHTQNVFELHPYYRESWFTAAGASLKLRRLQRAGIPDMSNWRFITVTTADRSISPQESYRRGNERMRRFLAKFRECVVSKVEVQGPLQRGRSGPLYVKVYPRWCWKLEFHDSQDEDGYPHWHIAFEYTKRIPPEMFPDIEKWWGLGRINIERIKGQQLRYLFKYMAKGTDELPMWVQHFKGRMRVFQACAGFWTKKKPRVVSEKKEPLTCERKICILERDTWDSKKGIIISRDERRGDRMTVVRLHLPFYDLLQSAAQWAILRRVPLISSNAFSIDGYQKQILVNEHKRTRGLGAIQNSQLLAAA